MNLPCIKCKGANPLQACGRAFCPITAKAQSLSRLKADFKKDFFGSSPTPFVGHNFYPNVYVGILTPPEKTEDAWLYDAPNYWAQQNLQIPAIIDYRSALVNSRFRSNVMQRSKFLEISQEVGMASKPVDVEINLKDKPHFRLNTDAYHAPMGPNANLEKARLAENPKIDTRVDKVVSDIDLKAGPAITYLYRHGFSENFLTRMLSIGNIGIKNDRKLVPTRWSITATDDTLAKDQLKTIRDFNPASHQAYFGGYLGNYFLVMLLPEPWSYELFELYAPKAEWNISNSFQYMTDCEPFDGRKTYADNCGGGYYASRLAVVEKLTQLRKQASVLVIRFITGEYAVPLGVWVVREAVRKALSSQPISFSSTDLLLRYAYAFSKKKFSYDLENLLKESILLRKLRTQSKLTNYI